MRVGFSSQSTQCCNVGEAWDASKVPESHPEAIKVVHCAFLPMEIYSSRIVR